MSDLHELDPRVEADLARYQKNNGIVQSKPIESNFVKNIRRLKTTVSSARNEIRLQSIEAFKRDALNVQISEAVKQDLAELLQGEKSRLDAEAKRVEKAYQRDLLNNENAYDRKARAQALRYQAMSKEELVRAGADFRDHPRAELPENIDALCACLKSVDPGLHSELRQTIQAEDRYNGWKFTDEGKKLVHSLEVFEIAIKKGDFVPLELQDGTYQIEQINQIVGQI